MDKLANPYVGPRTFEKTERDRFFGRERETRELLTLTVSEQLVLFYAQSGAGKSSLVNTHLLPDLEHKGFRALPVGRVGGDAPAELNVDNIYVFNLLRSVAASTVSSTSLASMSLCDFLSQRKYEFPIEDSEPSNKIVLVIDQFEELFSTHLEHWKNREDFFNQLAQAMQEIPYLWVVLVMREDYIASLEPYEHLLPGRLRMRYYMQRLGRDAALKAIKQPAEKMKRPYAPGVAEQLVEDLSSIKIQRMDGTPDSQTGQYVEPVQLQVVCFNLWEDLSWEGVSPGEIQITKQDLATVGDVDQSLEKHYARRVEDVAQHKQVSERAIRQWFGQKLITAGVRNIVLKDTHNDQGSLRDDVIAALQSDLVRAETRGGSIFYELTHDRLVDPILADNRRWEETHISLLQRQATVWDQQGRSDGLLLRGQELDQANEEAQAGNLTKTENEFLDASRELKTREERERLRNRTARILTAVSVIAMFLAIGFGISSYSATQRAETSRQEALDNAAVAETAKNEAVEQSERALSSDLILRAQETLSRPDLQTLLYLEAYRLDQKNVRSQSALLQSLQRYAGLKSFWNYSADQILFSPDGKTFATLEQDGITLWDLDGPTKRNIVPIREHFNPVYPSAFSSDGKYIATGSNDSSVVFWSLEDGQTPRALTGPLKEHTDWVDSVVFRPDDTVLASSADDRKIILWDLSEGMEEPTRLNTLSGHSGWIGSLAFSSDGKLLASGSNDNTVILWDVSDPKEASEIGQPMVMGGTVYAVAISKDNSILAAGSGDGYLTLFDISDSGQPFELSRTPNDESVSGVYGLAFNPVDNSLLAVGSGAAIGLWNISDPENPEPVGEPITTYADGESFSNGYIYSVVFSPDGKTLASSSSGLLILWDVSNPAKPIELSSTAVGRSGLAINSISFNPVDSTELITGARDGSLILWDVTDRTSPAQIGKPKKGHPGDVTEMEFSGDGSILISTGKDGDILINTETPLLMGSGQISYTGTDHQVMVIQYYDSKKNEDWIELHLPDETASKQRVKIQGTFVAISPSNQTIAYTTLDKSGKSSLNLWNITSQSPVTTEISGASLGFSPDGKIFAYETTDAEGNRLINSIDATSGDFVARDIEGQFVGFTFQSRFLLYQTFDEDSNTTYVESWDLAANEKGKLQIPGTYTATSKDGTTLLVYGMDEQGHGRFSLVNTASGEETLHPAELPEGGEGLSNAFLAGDTVYYQSIDPETGYAVANILDTTTDLTTSTPAYDGSVYSNDDVLVYYTNQPGSSATEINLRNLTTGKLIGKPIAGTFVSFVEDQNRMIYSFEDSSGNANIALMDLRNGQTIGAPQVGSFDKLRPDNEIIVYEGNSQIRLLNADTGFPIETPSIEGDILGFSSDGMNLIYKSRIENEKGTSLDVIGLLDTNTGSILNEITIRGANPSLQPNGNLLASTGQNGMIYFWDISQPGALGVPLQSDATGIQSAVLAPDGRTLAIVGEEGITLQDLDSPGQGVGPLNPHLGTVDSAVFSRTAQALLSVGKNGKSILWDLSKQPPEGTPIDGVGKGFSPDGRFAIVVNERNKVTQFMDVKTLSVVGDPIVGTATVFSPEGKVLVVLDRAQNRSRIIDLSRLPDSTLQLQESAGTVAVFSPGGQFLAINDNIDRDDTSLWDASTLTKFDQNSLGMKPEFSADDRFLLTSVPVSTRDLDSRFTVWSLTPTAITPLTNLSKKQARWMQFSPDGQYVLMETVTKATSETEEDKVELKLIDLTSGKSFPIRGKDPVFSPKGGYLATSDGYSIVLTTVSTQAELGLDIQGTDPVFSPQEEYLAVKDGKAILVWNLAAPKKLDWAIQGTNPVFSKNNQFLAVTVTEKEEVNTVLWDLRSGQNSTLSGAKPGFTADGKYLVNTDTVFSLELLEPIEPERAGNFATATNGNIMAIYGSRGVRLWDTANNVALGDPLLGHSASITRIQFGPNSNILASMAGDGIILSDVNGKILSKTIAGDSVSFNADGTILAVSSDTTGTILWDVLKNVPLDTVLPGIQGTFSPDGKFLKTTDIENGSTLIWNTATWEPIANPLSGIYSFFSEDSKRLAVIKPESAGKEGETDPATISIWDLGSDLQKAQGVITVHKPCQEDFCNTVAFSPDGKYLVHVESSSLGDSSFDLLLWDIEERKELLLGAPINVSGDIQQMSFVFDNRYGYLLLVQDDKGHFTISNALSGTRYSEPISGVFQTQLPNLDSLLYTRGSIGDLVRWDFVPQEWSNKMCERVGRNFKFAEWELIFEQRRYEKTCPQWP